jgi:hypothetical protein
MARENVLHAERLVIDPDLDSGPDSDPELEPTIKELRAALEEHIRRMRERVFTFPSPERRQDRVRRTG